MKTDNLKKLIPIITYAIILYFIVNNIGTFIGYINSGLKVLTPVIIGTVLAFIINLILRLYEKELFGKLIKKESKNWLKVKRPVCVILSYLTFALIIFIIVKFISPRISESISTLTNKIPAYINSVSSFLYNITLQHEFTGEIWKQVMDNLGLIITNTTQFLNSALPKLVNITKVITSSVFDVFIGIVFSVYILLSKEKLIKIIKKVLYVHLKEERAKRILDAVYHANKIFTHFVGGQLTEAIILGCLCYLGMSIFRMPYAPLISVIIGISSIVPVIGAIVGTIPCALLILLESPMMAVWFVLFVIVLQQVEGNIIYPKVVGNAIGISGFWVLLAVTIGGGTIGIMGIIIGVPLMAVVYSLYGGYINKRYSSEINETQQEL